MKKQIKQDEEGVYLDFNPYNCASISVAISSGVDYIRYSASGIRCFLVQQERNEWTHPENYPPISSRESMDPAAKNQWVVKRREDRKFQYETKI